MDDEKRTNGHGDERQDGVENEIDPLKVRVEKAIVCGVFLR